MPGPKLLKVGGVMQTANAGWVHEGNEPSAISTWTVTLFTSNPQEIKLLDNFGLRAARQLLGTPKIELRINPRAGGFIKLTYTGKFIRSCHQVTDTNDLCKLVLNEFMARLRQVSS